MVTFLIFSFFVLGFISVAIYFWQKPSTSIDPPALPPPERGLFVDSTAAGQAEALAAAEADGITAASMRERAELLEQAGTGEHSALKEAYKKDAAFYELTLDLLTANADSDPKLLSLVSYVSRHDFPVNPKLAERVIGCYQRTPDRSSTAKMLHVAALSNNAAVYQNTLETAMNAWRDGRLPGVSSVELRSIIEGEFWVLTAPVRGSSAAFLLKRALADARRQLEAAQS